LFVSNEIEPFLTFETNKNGTPLVAQLGA
jgi:hypothetical protein